MPVYFKLREEMVLISSNQVKVLKERKYNYNDLSVLLSCCSICFL